MSVEQQVDHLNQRVVLLCEQGQYKQAVGLATESCDLTRRYLSEAHPLFALSLNNLAALYYSVGNYTAAEPVYRQALEIRRKVLGQAHPDFAISLANLAELYHRMGHYAKAEPLSRQALDILRTALGEEHPDFAASLNNLAELYKSMGNYAAAEPLYSQALEVNRKVLGEEHPHFATNLNNLAALYNLRGKYIAAEPLYRQALEIRRRVLGEEHPDFAQGLNNLAGLYLSMGNYGAAEPLYRQALEIWRKVLGEEHPYFATSLNNLAEMYLTIGDYAAAEPLYRQVLEIRRRALGEEHPGFADSLSSLAGLYYSMGNYSRAEPLSRQALELRRRVLGEEHSDFALSLNNLAQLYSSMGNYAEAERLFHEALEILGRVLGEEHPEFATTVNNLAFLYCSMGNYSRAEALSRQALELRRRVLGEDHPDFATSLNNLAILYRSMTNYASAESLYRQALEVNRKVLGEKHPKFGGGLTNLAGLYVLMGDYTGAERLYRQALEIWREVLCEEHPGAAAGLNNLAEMYHSIGDYAQAEPLYRRALEIQRKVLGEEHPDFGTSLSNLAALYVPTRRENEALDLMQQAAAIDDRMIGQVFSIGSESQRMEYITTIQGHLDKFLSLVVAHLSSSKKAVRAAVDLVLRRKAIGAEVLAVQRDAVLGGKYPTLEPSLRELTSLRMQIARKTLSGPGAERIEVYRSQLAEWNARRERLEAGLARQVPEMNVEQKLRAAERHTVALALPTGAALVEFLRFEVFDFKAIPARSESQWRPARYLAFVLRAGDPDNVLMIDLGEAEPIDQMIAAFRSEITGESESRRNEGLEARRTPFPKISKGELLRTAVFDPLLSALKNRKHLLLATDGDLTRLPFEVLPTRAGSRLIDEYPISYLGAGRDILRFRAARNARPTNPLVVADPDFDLSAKSIAADRPPAPQPARSALPVRRQSRDLDLRTLHFERLRGTREEGRHIAGMLGVPVWLEGTALEARLKACKSPRILHLATHGYFLPDQKRDSNEERREPSAPGAASGGTTRRVGPRLENPLLRSGLALAGANTWCRGEYPPPEAEDGILTAEDVSGLNLLDTELVVLSACDTGLGEVRRGEGVFGLRRAFVVAGTKALIMSLWKVPDDETRELMESFYQRILDDKPGQNHAAALRAAQLAMKKKQPNPCYWGAFIYQGDPHPAS